MREQNNSGEANGTSSDEDWAAELDQLSEWLDMSIYVTQMKADVRAARGCVVVCVCMCAHVCPSLHPPQQLHRGRSTVLVCSFLFGVVANGAGEQVFAELVESEQETAVGAWLLNRIKSGRITNWKNILDDFNASVNANPLKVGSVWWCKAGKGRRENWGRGGSMD